MAMIPAPQWDQIHPQLWLQIISPTRPIAGDHSDSEHLVKCLEIAISPQESKGQIVQAHKLCWEFGSHGICNWELCQYQHACSLCGESHSF